MFNCSRTERWKCHQKQSVNYNATLHTSAVVSHCNHQESVITNAKLKCRRRFDDHCLVVAFSRFSRQVVTTSEVSAVQQITMSHCESRHCTQKKPELPPKLSYHRTGLYSPYCREWDQRSGPELVDTPLPAPQLHRRSIATSTRAQQSSQPENFTSTHSDVSTHGLLSGDEN